MAYYVLCVYSMSKQRLYLLLSIYLYTMHTQSIRTLLEALAVGVRAGEDVVEPEAHAVAHGVQRHGVLVRVQVVCLKV